MANSFTSLEEAAARTIENLRIFIAEEASVEAIQQILAGQQPGRGKIRINIFPTNIGWHADLELAQHYNLSPDAQLTLRGLPGVLKVENFDIR